MTWTKHSLAGALKVLLAQFDPPEGSEHNSAEHALHAVEQGAAANYIRQSDVKAFLEYIAEEYGDESGG
jgi:hypothetical protein